MFGDNLRKIRTERNMTQHELADLLNVSDGTISSWEVNRTEPNMAMIERLAAYLRVSRSELIGDVAILTYTEKRMVDQFRQLDPVQQSMIIASLDAAYMSAKKGDAYGSAS